MSIRNKLRNYLSIKSNWAYIIPFFVLVIAYIVGFFNYQFSYIAIGGLFLFIAIENFVKSIGFFENIKDTTEANAKHLANISETMAKFSDNANKNGDMKFYLNDLTGGFEDMFSKTKHIKYLRIFTLSTNSVVTNIFAHPDIKIDECVILVEKSKISTRIIEKWKAIADGGCIGKLTIVPYERQSDLWYIICDESRLLTDLFIYDGENYAPYVTNKNRSLMFVSSETENGRKYVNRYIEQFDSHVQHYRKMNGALLEKQYNE
jgi:hypothetical protein